MLATQLEIRKRNIVNLLREDFPALSDEQIAQVVHGGLVVVVKAVDSDPRTVHSPRAIVTLVDSMEKASALTRRLPVSEFRVLAADNTTACSAAIY